MASQKRAPSALVGVQYRPFGVDEQLPAICTARDICRYLRMSDSQYRTLRRRGTFPIPEIRPRIDNKARFRGEDVRKYLRGELDSGRRPKRTKAA